MKHSKSNLFYLILVSFFLALTFLSSYISSFLKFPFLNGNPIEIYLIFFVFSMILINRFFYRLLYFLLAPILLLLTPGLYFLNAAQVIVDYILTFYCFFVFLFFNFSWGKLKIKEKEIKYTDILIFLLFFLISIFLKWWIHLISGYYWWTNNDIYLSTILNSRYVFVSFAIILPVTVAIYYPLKSLNKAVY
ncbi:MAG: hypothetical protein RR201_00065 [Malacoplasma sp.]